MGIQILYLTCMISLLSGWGYERYVALVRTNMSAIQHLGHARLLPFLLFGQNYLSYHSRVFICVLKSFQMSKGSEYLFTHNGPHAVETALHATPGPTFRSGVQFSINARVCVE